jgi:hypothetical protein
MKTLLFFLIFLPCTLSCSKHEDNFAVIQIINLQTRNQIAIDCPGKRIILNLAYDNLNDDERLSLIDDKTFSKWVAPFDTIWVLKDYPRLPDMYFVYADSILFTSFVKSAVPYVCPEY